MMSEGPNCTKVNLSGLANSFGGLIPGESGQLKPLPWLQRPRIVVISGLPGTGKTRLAESLSVQLELPVFSVAWVLGALAGFGLLERPDRGAMAYEIIGGLLEHRLRLRQSAIADGMIGSVETRTRWRDVADRYRADFIAVECVCSDLVVHRARIEARQNQIPGWPDPGWDHVEEMRKRYEPWAGNRLVLDSVLPFERNLRAAKRVVMESLASSPSGFEHLANDQ
jgi:predicted kinase